MARGTKIFSNMVGINKPPEGFVKLYVDVAFDDETGYISSSCWGSSYLPFIDTRLTAEACARQNGLITARPVRRHRLLVESDCIEVVKGMQNGGNSLGVAAAIYKNVLFYVVILHM